MALSNKVGQNLRVGHGIYGYEPKMTYLYGLPWILSSGGIHVDLADLSASEALDGSYDNNKNYRTQSGMLGSALEHMIPEQMFNTDPANPVHGVSTMKALQLASQQGQKVYAITQANADTVLPILTHSQMTMNDITAAINAGYTVTTHESPIQVPGWSGSGYIIADQHGNGAYIISGGQNGAFMKIAYASLLDILGLMKSLDKIIPKIVGPILSGLFTLLSNWGKMMECWNNGIAGKLKAMFFMATMGVFIFMMFQLLVMPIGPVVGYMFAFTMETMMSDMEDILDTC